MYVTDQDLLDAFIEIRLNKDMKYVWRIYQASFRHSDIYIWGHVYQKQVSRAATSNYISQILWDVITYAFPWCLLLAHKTSYLLTLITIICYVPLNHYDDVTMSLMASQITSITIVYSAVYSGADQRKHQSSASLAFVRWIHRGPVNSPHKWPVTRKMFPFDDVIMFNRGQDMYRLLMTTVFAQFLMSTLSRVGLLVVTMVTGQL